MSRFLFVSDYGDIAWLARRLQDDGHDVWLATRDPASKDVGRGFVPLLQGPVAPRDAVVIFDGVNHGGMGAAFRRRGHGVIGGNPFDADLELDRAKGTRLMQQAGIAVPETKAFTSLGQAQAFLATHRGHYFFKASGNLSTSLTHDGEAGDLARYLKWAANHVKGVKSFELQKRVEGTEVSLEGWFDGTKWVGPFNSTLEAKKFLVDDLGPRTGCQSNVVWAWQTETLAQATVMRLTPKLRATGYVGPLDLNMILDEDGTPHGLEWSARTGFDALQALSLLIDGDLGKQLEQFAHGRLRAFDVRQDMTALTLRLSVPPYPVESATMAKQQRGLPLDPALVKDSRTIMLDDVMLDDDGEPVLAGRDGALGVLGTTGRDIGTMRAELLERATALRIPSLQYRTDPIARAEEAWSALADFGYLSARDVPSTGVRPGKREDFRSRTAPNDGANPPSDALVAPQAPEGR